jgi:crotonobetaine/carnitine-CoA ligase
LTSLLYSAPPRADDADNPVRYVLLGPMIPEIERFEARFGVRVAVAYGQTEIGVMLASGWDHGPPESCGTVRVSYPWPEVRIVDEHDRPLGPGEVGELIVRTRAPWALNAGYYKMPQETTAAWRNGWFHTGDALRYDDDGRFYFVDRLKDAIRRRGENISSFEVENLVTEHPRVVECAAVGVDAAHGDQEIMVAVVVNEPSAFDPGELITFLTPRMPQFMLPRFVEVVGDLPRSETSGRVRKRELRERGTTSRTWDRERPTPAMPAAPDA